MGTLPHRVRQQGLDVFLPAEHGAADLPLGGDEHRAWGTDDSVGLRDLPISWSITLPTPCSCALARFSWGPPRLTSAMVSFSWCSSCQRPTFGNIAVQGPQFGSVRTALRVCRGRRAPRVRLSP